ncbi:c-type cytochrome biogenesis protein CcmI [Thalassococcus lentus]|uniref:C-type cytochrome biogenesis protein CcmI n=1 Tax=Thalassococcus lentus TaxID=1210524 RepID=A0ABT4XS41_9RHOB|nr:c-type cytochrome biogenesis protein CcmI [Thalassococcus lentus]MDA7424773.1 c-type cytochrome biogenesis protein CcmI [Thalassococcus lentus]
MTLFWIATGLMALSAAALMALALLRGRRDTGPAEAFDLQVYRDQLKEIERDTARGVIAPDEAERLRTEVSRRILAADSAASAARDADGQPLGRGGLIVAGLMGAVVLGGGFGLYSQLGAPGYPDLPLKQRIAAAAEAMQDRPSQAEAESQVPAQPQVDADEKYLDLVVKLRGAVAERPDDLQGLRLLARSEAALGNYSAAWKAQDRIIALKGEDATAKDYSDLADMLVLAAGGYVSPEAQTALEQTLIRDPQNGVARYYGGLMLAQTGRPDSAFRLWDRLLRQSPPDAPWVAPIRQQIEDMAWRAGVADYTLPEADTLRGPTAEDIENAGEMSAEDRAAMIQNMVAGLAERLGSEGGPPEEWARLINALMVLGRADEAKAILTDARMAFADAPEALALINQTATQAGLGE